MSIGCGRLGEKHRPAGRTQAGAGDAVPGSVHARHSPIGPGERPDALTMLSQWGIPARSDSTHVPPGNVRVRFSGSRAVHNGDVELEYCTLQAGRDGLKSCRVVPCTYRPMSGLQGLQGL